MVLEEYVDINITKNNYKYYEKKGYNPIIGQTLRVKNEDLAKNSKYVEKRQCDNPECKKIIEREHRNWYTQNQKFHKDLCNECSKKLTMEKVKETNLEKYGVEYPFQSKEVREKRDKTFQKKYGDSNIFNCSEIQDKVKQTLKEKYGGYEGMAKDKDIVEKRKTTNLEKYRVECVFQSEEIKDKIKDTINEKYGVDYIHQSQEIKEKTKNTFIEKYGVEYALQFGDFKEKQQNTCLERYGSIFAMQNEEIKEKASTTLEKNGCVKTSQQQIKLYEQVKRLFPECEVELNKRVSSIFLDVFLKISEATLIDIEYDGTYWHQDAQKDRRRDEFLKGLGYKILRIVSEKDNPTDEQVQKAISLLSHSERKFYKINIDSKTTTNKNDN